VITGAGRIPAKYVIHTVWPVWHGGHNDEDEIPAGCCRNSFQLAADHMTAFSLLHQNFIYLVFRNKAELNQTTFNFEEIFTESNYS